MINHMINC